MLMLRGLLLFVGFVSAMSAGATEPFWKAKEKVYTRIENGEVIVSVRSERHESQSPPNQMIVGGGGWVKAPVEFVFEKVQDYTGLAKASDYIKSVEYDETRKKLNFVISAFTHQSRFVLAMHADPDAKTIAMLVEEGPLTGFRLRLSFAPVRGGKTEIGIQGEYGYDRFPIPRLFLEFGMEVVLQRMAGHMRSYVERAYKDRKP